MFEVQVLASCMVYRISVRYYTAFETFIEWITILKSYSLSLITQAKYQPQMAKTMAGKSGDNLGTERRYDWKIK